MQLEHNSTHFDLFNKAKGNLLTLCMCVINVGVQPAVDSGGACCRLLRRRTERRHSKEMSAVYSSSYPTPPAIPPTGPLMSEKPAFFSEESEATRIATATSPPPPRLSTKKEKARKLWRERGKSCWMGWGKQAMNWAGRRKVLLESFPCHTWAFSHKQEG